MAFIVLADSQSPKILEEAAQYLRDAGHQVTMVRDGRQAVAAFHETPPDVLVVASLLWHLDGYQVIEELESLHPQRPTQTIWIPEPSHVFPSRPIVVWEDTQIHSYLARPYRAWQLVLSVEQLIYRRVISQE
jgi:CheY-like chemotaxis protein